MSLYRLVLTLGGVVLCDILLVVDICSDTEKDITKYDTAQSQNEQVQVPAQVAGTPVPEVKPTLSPSMKTWKQAIAFTASQKDSIENLSARLKAKYTITDEHLDLLLTLSGKKAANRIQS